jgi:Uri superfamily endonuclease
MAHPAAKGTYILLAHLDADTDIQIGRLGTFIFLSGWYAYAGSALGPGGLRARLARHQRPNKRLHWHIDYVLSYSTLESIWQIASQARLECAWASALQTLPGARVLVPGFGSSDCRCVSHLVYYPHHPPAGHVMEALVSATPDGRPSGVIHCVDVTGRSRSTPLRAQAASTSA